MFPRAAALSLAIALLCLVPSAATADVDSGWLSMSAEGVTVRYRSEDAQAARRILTVAGERADAIAREMGLAALSPVTITIAATDEDFGRQTAGGVPDWGVGCADPGGGTIVVKSPRIVPYPLQVEDVVVHELAHVAVGRVLRGIPVPRWFHEGIAMAVAGEWRLGESGDVAAALAGGHLLPLRALRSRFPESGRAAMLAYTESFYAVELMKQRAGARTPGELVRTIAFEGSFDRALAAMTGGDEESLDEALAGFVERRLGWSHLLMNGRFMFAGVAVLFLIAVVIRVRRSRRRMAEWDAGTDGANRGSREEREGTRWDWKH